MVYAIIVETEHINNFSFFLIIQIHVSIPNFSNQFRRVLFYFELYYLDYHKMFDKLYFC